MLKHCINPGCGTEFKLFNTGYLYAHDRPGHDTEFYWLCAPCASSSALYLDLSDRVAMRPRSRGTALPPRRGADLRLISAPSQRVPWQRNAPAGEAIPATSATLTNPPASSCAA